MKRFVAKYWLFIFLLCAGATALSAHLIASKADENPPEVFPSLNYSQIEDGLYLGGILSEPPKGVRAVLNVCETRDPYRAEFHLWEPIGDLGPAPDLDWLRAQVQFIDKHMRAGHPIYVHCRAGVNRSAMVTAAYLMWRDSLTRDEALGRIKEKRPRIGPFPVYKKFLAEWEKALK